MNLPLLQPEPMESTEPDTLSPIPSDSLGNQISKYKTMFTEAYKRKPIPYWILLFISIIAMLVAFPASGILSRVYYDNGGQSKWIISWVAVAGWPITALILLPTYMNKVNASIINANVVITAALTIIALDSSSDKYPYITDSQYIMGYVWDILGSALHGLIFALSELVFVKLLGRRSFIVVLEQQVMVSLFGFLFTTVGVIVSGGFQGMASEASTFKSGKSAYYLVLIWSAITFQFGVLGGTAVIFLASTVLAGVLNAVRTPITSIAAVILLHDPMSGFKILSLLVTIWGFGSYIYGSSMDTKSS